MGLFSFVKKQLPDVIEWADMDDNTLFHKWGNSELKKGSRLILRPGQDAIFYYQGAVQGIFTEEGDYDIESQIIPLLSTLMGIKWGFDSGKRAEILFVNTREFTIQWGTSNPINLPMAGLPGGMPIRAFGNFICQVCDYNVLIEKVVGVKSTCTVEDIRERLASVNDQLLMKWIVKEGKDMFNLQANAYDISQGLMGDLNAELAKVGVVATTYNIQSVSYPDNVREMQEKAAGAAMVGDVNAYTQVQMANGMANGEGGGNNTASQMAQMAMGMAMGQQMAANMAGNAAGASAGNGEAPKFCPECGTPTNGAKFCPNCGKKLV